MPIPRPEGPLNQILSQLNAVWDYLDTVLGNPPIGGENLLDETGDPLLDESGANLIEE
jgi:hypothetical protein